MSEFCTFLIILLILIFTLFISIWLINNTYSKERFSQKNEQNEQNKKKPLTIAWKERWEDLLKINPTMYKKYFGPIIINDWKKVTHQPNIIFISIASYRDNQCINTVQNIAEMADHPENLHFVICQQNSILEKDCIKWCKKKKNHPACKVSVTKIERLTYLEARGPTWARWRIQQLWSGEEYFLQIDAHTRMIKRMGYYFKKST